MIELENVLISCAFEGYNINFFCQMIKHTIMVDGLLVLLLPVRILEEINVFFFLKLNIKTFDYLQ